MPTPDDAEGLRSFYEEGYSLRGPAAARADAWRRLGAGGKADRLMAVLGNEDRPGLRAVEIGCGDGSLLAELARRRPGWALAGAEVADQPVAIARERVPEARIERYDGERLPWDDGAFDLAVLSHVLEHVLDPVGTLREAARVAHTVVVEVPLEDNVSARRAGKRRGAQEIGHLHRFSRRRMRRLAGEAGLHVAAELTDPLPRAVHRFFAATPAARARADLKWALRRALHALPAGAGEHLMTVHYACRCHAAPAARSAPPGEPAS